MAALALAVGGVAVLASCSGSSTSTTASGTSAAPGTGAPGTSAPAATTAPGQAAGTSAVPTTGATPRTALPLGPGEVAIVDYAFTPQTVTVPVGGKVTWVNQEADPPSDHWVRSVPGTPGGIDSGRLKPGTAWSMTFPAAGTYAYYCDIHNFMKGTVVVG